MRLSIIISHVSSQGKLPNPIGGALLQFVIWVGFYFLIQQFFTCKLCIMSTLIYHVFLPYKFHIVLIQFYYSIDSLQSWSFKLWCCIRQVFWTTVALTAIFHIIFCIFYSVLGCCKSTVCSSWVKLYIQTNSICTTYITKTNTNIIMNFCYIISGKIINFSKLRSSQHLSFFK